MPNLLLLALLATFPALSTDMYLPAIPTLQAMWGISLAEANLSLVVFFLAFSGCLLIHGPLSDRFGRRPVLINGILLFVVGCGLCAVSNSITMLVLARMVQAAGAAAASALSLALCKDLYEGAMRQKTMAYIGVILAFSPMLAPSLGGLMLQVASWRWIFVCQAGLACIALYGAFRLEEPLTEFTAGGALAVAGRYIQVLKNKRFVVLALAFAMMTLPHFAFIGGSPDIFITGFGVSEQAFGYYFGLNALGVLLGSFACTRLTGRIKSGRLLVISLFGIVGGGLLMLLLGGQTPLAVVIPMFCITFSTGFSRPISNHMILDQVDSDVGAASSVLTFEIFFVGGAAMELIALDWPSKPMVIGVLALIGAIIPLGTLALVQRPVSPESER
ncbi:multidrug effflux MFS transporter [Pseudodesulfovibrio sp.]|nr:multidrug effflux MFS transporter [Pseudodesulfovibrio sp.]